MRIDTARRDAQCVARDALRDEVRTQPWGTDDRRRQERHVCYVLIPGLHAQLAGEQRTWFEGTAALSSPEQNRCGEAMPASSQASCVRHIHDGRARVQLKTRGAIADRQQCELHAHRVRWSIVKQHSQECTPWREVQKRWRVNLYGMQLNRS